MYIIFWQNYEKMKVSCSQKFYFYKQLRNLYLTTFHNALKQVYLRTDIKMKFKNNQKEISIAFSSKNQDYQWLLRMHY